ncbi:hypothetical protein EJ04DRAFT_128388 [Polyplosphaeria fusca]|uniref:Uncharacterized protein n=1 Tax=Polyplosphaeria fusca TaxID=682080 RepID=A0A9P4UX32_9PLEO|nr:hypothetical protein EJ04DRAFT_128388 [Polyplosphaeria fusca]
MHALHCSAYLNIPLPHSLILTHTRPPSPSQSNPYNTTPSRHPSIPKHNPLPSFLKPRVTLKVHSPQKSPSIPSCSRQHVLSATPSHGAFNAGHNASHPGITHPSTHAGLYLMPSSCRTLLSMH